MIRAEEYQERDRILSLSNSEQSQKRGVNFVLYQNIQEEGLIQQIIPLHQSTVSILVSYFLYFITLGFLYLILKWRLDWKIFLLYNEVPMAQAEYVAIFGPDFDIQIERLQIVMPQGRTLKMFMYRYYRYAFYEDINQVMPLSDQVGSFTTNQIINSYQGGLNSGQVVESQKKNGLNATQVPEKSVMSIIVDEVLSPFYIFQIFSITLWYVDEYRIYATVILISSIIGIIVQVREAKLNIRKLKEISHQSGGFKVLRDGRIETIDPQLIVFGDRIYIEEDEVCPCDLLILEGSAIVNEAMLTGESIPVIKTNVLQSDAIFIENKQNIIYSGSKLLSQNNLQTQAIRTSFETLKGNLIRSILYPKKHSQLSFYADSMKFILVLAGVALISFIISIPSFLVALHNGYMTVTEIFIRSLDLITISVPPALPTALSFGVSFALKRLSEHQIFCVNPQKINVCGKVKTVCFDKTGTLTEEGLLFKSMRSCNKGNFEVSDSTNLSQNEASNVIQKVITASCHSLMKLKGQLLGDPMDIEMFKQTNYDIIDQFNPLYSDGTSVIAELQSQKSNLNQNQYESSENSIQQSDPIYLLKRFQFESECQMMSVLAYYRNSKLVLSKGSPEKIQNICVAESIPKNYKQILEEYTMHGYRVIALSYREIISNLQLEDEREIYERDQTFAGFLIFENKLKEVTIDHIQLLKSKSIKVIMITGDNALTATQVAKNCSIINQDTPAQILDYSINDRVTTLNDIPINLQTDADLEQLLNQDLTISGNFFDKYMNSLNHNTNLTFLMAFLTHAKIYARMKPDQKQYLISLLQRQDPLSYTFVAMCGDGANDCGALKDADMGVSLSDTEASIAASFTSKIQNISCIEIILKEGRASLVTSFQCFKYMALYSLIQCATTTILYISNSIPSDIHFLYWDLFIILPLAFMLGLTKSKEHLTHKTPTANLISHEVIVSVLGQTTIQVIFQGIRKFQHYFIFILLNVTESQDFSFTEILYQFVSLIKFMINIYLY